MTWDQKITSEKNKQWWQKMDYQECSFAIPWLELTVEEVRRYRSGKLPGHPLLQDISTGYSQRLGRQISALPGF